MTEQISPDKFNEITYAISRRQQELDYKGNAHADVFSRYPADVVAAYNAECARLDAREARMSDTRGTF